MTAKSTPEKVIHKVLRRGQLPAKADGTSLLTWVTRAAMGAALGFAIVLLRRTLA